MNKQQIKEIVEKMSVDELVGQVINLNLAWPQYDEKEYEKICSEIHPGSIFLNYPGTILTDMTEAEKNQLLIDIADKYSSVPTVACTDGSLGDLKNIPSPMAWGATAAPEKYERFAEIYAKMLRRVGNGILLGPVCDINYNKNSPIVNTRAVSDDYKHVIKMCSAYIKGLTAKHDVVACCKHFPGDGMDDRNQHYCTTVNSMDKQEWMDTYGQVYRQMFKAGATAVMCAHISLPSWQPEEERDPVKGYLPCSLSPSLMTGLLKGALGFEGCIISDAIDMIGMASACKRSELAVRFIKAGGDMLLFARPEDFYSIRNAVNSGEISTERLCDAVTRVLRLKNEIGLLDGKKSVIPCEVPNTQIEELFDFCAENSIVVERNANNVLPLRLKEGDRIFVANLFSKADECHQSGIFEPLINELKDRGYIVDVRDGSFDFRDLKDAESKYACILVNCESSVGCSNGGTLRLGHEHIKAFWDGYGLENPKLVFAAFGDPYKLYEFPFLDTFVNCFCAAPKTQHEYLRVLFSEAEAKGKNPVKLDGYFERQV